MFYALNSSEPGDNPGQEFYSDTAYPKVIYRATEPVDDSYLPIEGKERRAELDRIAQNKVRGLDVETEIVHNERQEEEALSEGWHLTPELAAEAVGIVAKRGPGRPRREVVTA